MSAELALIAGSSIAGAISAAVIEKLSKSRTGTKGKKPVAAADKPVTAARSELVSLLFEKGLASEAITRVYEASQEGRIDRLERDRLLVKYKQQLDSLNHRIAALKPVADMADLTELRNNLVSLLEDKISALDQKLLQMSKPGSAQSDTEAVDAKVQKIIAETAKVQAPVIVEQKPFKAEEKSIEQLQGEIMQALQRLEQVEIDKD